MEIIGKRIKLRPFKRSDIEDYIKWMTVETEWMEWDAPWEENDFNVDEYRQSCLLQLQKNRPVSIYSTREIEMLHSGEHIGRINSYPIDENYNYSREGKNLTIGITIFDPAKRKQGFGTEAWLLHINYLLDNGQKEIFTQTWSGNYPVQALMQKLGFELIDIEKACQTVKGKKVDGLTFKLNNNKFQEAYREWNTEY